MTRQDKGKEKKNKKNNSESQLLEQLIESENHNLPDLPEFQDLLPMIT